MVIWRTDANGQIGWGEEGGAVKKCHIHIIGPYARAKKTGKGHGTYLAKICQSHRMIPARRQHGKSQKWKKRTDGEIQTPRKHDQGKMGGKCKLNTSLHGQAQMGNKKTNRLHRDQCELQEHFQKGTEQQILARQHEPEPEAPSPDDAIIL